MIVIFLLFSKCELEKLVVEKKEKLEIVSRWTQQRTHGAPGEPAAATSGRGGDPREMLPIWFDETLSHLVFSKATSNQSPLSYPSLSLSLILSLSFSSLFSLSLSLSLSVSDEFPKAFQNRYTHIYIYT